MSRTLFFSRFRVPHGSSLVLATLVLFAPLAPSRATAAENWKLTRERTIGSPRMQGASAITFSSQGHLVIAGFTDGRIAVFNRLGREQARFPAHDGMVTALAISSDDKVLVTGSEDNTIAVWFLNSGLERHRLSQASKITALAFLTGNRRVVSGSDAGKLSVWDIDSGRLIRQVEAHHYAVIDLAIAAGESELVATVGGDRRIKIFDAKSGKREKEMPLSRYQVSALALSPDGEFLAGASGRVMTLWEVATGRVKRTWQRLSSPIKFVRFGAGGSRLIVGSTSYRDQVRVLDTRTGREIMSSTLPAQSKNWEAMALSPAEGTLAIGGRESLSLWSFVTEEQMVSFQGTGHSASMTAVTYAPNGKMLVTASEDRTIRFWDLRFGKERRQFKHHSPISSMALSRDGKFVACAGGRFVQLWKVKTGKQMRYKRFPYNVHSIDFAPDGRMLALGGADGSARVWDSLADVQRHNLSGHRKAVTCIAYSPDGRTVASGGGDFTAILWDAKSGEILARLPHGQRVGAVAYSRDGRRLATASIDDHIRLWHVPSGNLEQEFKVSRGGQRALAFSPNGKVLASCGADQRIHLYSVESGEERFVTRRQGSALNAIAFSREGRYLATGTEDSSGAVWKFSRGWWDVE